MCLVQLCVYEMITRHSRPQRPRSFWSALKITTSGQVQRRKSAIHRLPVTLRMLWVKSDKSDWFWSQSIVFTRPFKTRMSLDLARGRDFQCWPKGSRPLRTRMWIIPELRVLALTKWHVGSGNEIAQSASMVSMAHAWNGCSQSSRFPNAGQRERSSMNEI